MKQLNYVLAQQEPAHDEVWAGADEILGIWSVSLVQRHRNWRFHRPFPFPLEVLSPRGELAETTDIIQYHVELSVICRRELR